VRKSAEKNKNDPPRRKRQGQSNQIKAKKILPKLNSGPPAKSPKGASQLCRPPPKSH
jgi:hypothetical protein